MARFTERLDESYPAASASPGTSLISLETIVPKSGVESVSAPLLETSQPPDWPTAPRAIRPSVGSIIADWTVDIVLFAASLAFLTFAFLVRKYDKTPVADHPSLAQNLLRVSEWGPSVIPILFASVLARAAHATMVWRLEQGEEVAVLDLLAGSTSLTSTVTTQLKLRIWSILGLLLVLIWSLSPIGGQASLRQVSIASEVSSRPASFTYMIPGGDLSQFAYSDAATWWGVVNTLFGASIIAPKATKASPRDTWGNVKIPLIEDFEQNGEADKGGWFNTNQTVAQYASVIGIPISGTNATEFIDYTTTIEQHYFHLDCPLINGTYTTEPNNTFRGDGAYMWYTYNSTQRANTPLNELRPANFTYMSWGSTGVSHCTITTTYIEAEITCPTASQCAVSRLRRSTLPHPPPAYTQLDAPSPLSGWDVFANAFVQSASGHPAFPTIVQYYLTSPEDPVTALAEFYGDTSAPPTLPSNTMYAIRLAQLMNAYWTAANGIYAISSGLDPSTAYLPDQTYNSVETVLFANTSTTTGQKSASVAVIKAHIPWVVTLAFVSIVMIFASLASPMIRFFLVCGPDVMLNFSSLATRENPFVPLPRSGTFMDAGQRSRRLRGVRVRLGDVEPGAEVGRLVVVGVEGGGSGGGMRVRRKRLYR